MANYRTGRFSDQSQTRRDVVCEWCGDVIGQGAASAWACDLTAALAVGLWPALRNAIERHEPVCLPPGDLSGH